MKPRTRSIGALLALMALSVYFAESVGASMCPPQMQMGGMVEAIDEEAAGHPCETGMGDACGAESPGQPRSGMMDCPFGPLGASGSCVALSLPAPPAQVEPSFPDGCEPAASADAAHDRLPDTALFHPPKP